MFRTILQDWETTRLRPNKGSGEVGHHPPHGLALGWIKHIRTLPGKLFLGLFLGFLTMGWGETVSAQTVRLTHSYNNFGFNIFSEVTQRNTNQNIFISPLSLELALSMAYNGAKGTTQQSMANVLNLEGFELDALNQSNAALIRSLQAPNTDIELTLSNSIWVDQNLPIHPAFLQKNQDFYQAKIANLNFRDLKAPAIINAWVAQSTKGKIQRIIDSIPGNTGLFLINAIYFKGKWNVPFDATQTSMQPFHRPNGTTRSIPLMAQTGKYRYHETETFQAIALPYQNDHFSFYIVLPQASLQLGDFYRQFSAETWQDWLAEARPRDGHIKIPRFKVEYTIELAETLKAMGMGTAFDASTADFSGLTHLPAFLSQVKHKTFLEVNEEGTEAAGSTAVGVAVRSAAQLPPFEMVVDRPFFCAIRDNRTGSILFMGSIVDPMD